jgi:hypothetical protein
VINPQQNKIYRNKEWVPGNLPCSTAWDLMEINTDLRRLTQNSQYGNTIYTVLMTILGPLLSLEYFIIVNK